MQISHVHVVPIDLDLSVPYRTATLPDDLVPRIRELVRLDPEWLAAEH